MAQRVVVWWPVSGGCRYDIVHLVVQYYSHHFVTMLQKLSDRSKDIKNIEILKVRPCHRDPAPCATHQGRSLWPWKPSPMPVSLRQHAKLADV